MGEIRKTKYLLVGGGVASVEAAIGIRELDKDGSILIVHAEPGLPYDRPPLSKGILQGKMSPEDAESKDGSFYPENNVDLALGTSVDSIGLSARHVSLSDGTVVEYEKLLLATGARPRKPEMPGIDLAGAHLLREMPDSLAIKESMSRSKQAVFIGAGYIGMEVAADCLGKGISVTLIDPNDHPWGKLVSPATGNFLRREFEKQGAKFLFNDEAAEIGGSGKVESVKTKSGHELPADMVVVGIGVERNLELARDAGLEMHDRHGVVVDETLRTSDPNVWAAGDIAAYIDPVAEDRWHNEHYLNASWQGRQAGRNMAGAGEKYDKVAYFFSDMGDIHMALRGCPNVGKSAKVIGDIDAGEFVELYAREDGSLSMGIVFSRNESVLDPISDKLESDIQNRADVAKLDETSYGLDADKGLG
jgi:3-phenylpropionate/trans-cinnamate dioxygenase ferredoxin reductase subunit